ncbi:MAG: hypothetical protein A2Y03_06600 [Omnitrophica WOR_2 bacterium GWF2_38_59]|nr:MAG: hypothetical protein A2Y03_06600 [Omnitrophica WOR_2 bacterium GWF2_38_59]OGX50480.1 MAG: hypothetical protein A2243_01975 [Omnitrophica WOR_2 bacterium RIFOXYA2_FULL_38_17]OGX59489.1 MAG: hypothetical protein A2306_09600 [Omnitrophica WOR_2 bacterium RIFOXYB2_FULL_38_16]HBG62045.1 hypothetical protein [Candidatus Omnitrophota bacterium]
MKIKKTFNKKASALIVVLIALVIIAIMFSLSMRKKEPGANNNSKGFLKESGVDASSYKSTLDSTKKVIADVEASRENVDY